MSTATIQGRIDSALKQQTETTLKSMGLSMSTAIHLFCRQVVNQGRIPFEIVAPKLQTPLHRKLWMILWQAKTSAAPSTA